MTPREIFTVHGLGAHVDAFERAPVRVEDLSALTDDDLRAHFGLVGFMDRKRFHAIVAAIAREGESAPVVADGVTRVDTTGLVATASRASATHSAQHGGRALREGGAQPPSRPMMQGPPASTERRVGVRSRTVQLLFA